MRNLLVMTAVGSVLALGTTAIAARPASLDGLVHKVQSGDKEEAPGARGQGGGKSTGGRDDGAGLRGGQGKGGDKSAQPGKGAGERGSKMRSGAGEKGTGKKQRATERGGGADVDVDIRGGRGYRGGGDGRTRIDIDADRRRRGGGRDVDVNVRGYRPSKGGVDCEQIIRRYSMCFRR